MNDIIQIEILDKAGHEDLKFSVRDLTADLTFDTYYFGLAIEPQEKISDLKNCVASFLSHWVTRINLMQDGQTSYFPIDLSDQYTGCLKIVRQGNELEISYGTSFKEGCYVNIINPESYFDSITDFQTDIPKTLSVKKEDFIVSLQNQINLLSNSSNN